MVLNSAKHDAKRFFKVLLLSSHLLISAQKSKFGICAVTGYCSFNGSALNLIMHVLNYWLKNVACVRDFWY